LKRILWVRFFFETKLSFESLLDMIVLEETDILQTFACTPRQSVFDTIRVFSEAENTSVDITEFTSVGVGYYYDVTAIFDLRENFTYTIKLLSEGNVVFFDKMFCTNQTVSDFSVNDNEYIQRESANNFIVI
jgi:hypothetical protein